MELTSGKLIQDAPADGVVRLRIVNPQRRGALDHELLDTLAMAIRKLDARCLVLTGSGDVFSAGYDLGDLEGEAFAEAAEQLIAHPFQEAIAALDACPVPTIAALNGHAIGGGLELAASCDMRIAAASATFAMPPARLGLVYSHTGLRRFLELCGPAHTSELFYVADSIDADRAERIGLVNRIVGVDELEGMAVEMAARIATNAPLSIAGNKRILRALRAAEGELDDQSERELIELREACFSSEDFREGVRAFAEKRAPRWRGR